ncbi:hypothetical protein G6F53_014154 [Rhizopus delemar]|nr:hypothetical protein G6F53_014154 [Rhizopus delemar]
MPGRPCSPAARRHFHQRAGSGAGSCHPTGSVRARPAGPATAAAGRPTPGRRSARWIPLAPPRSAPPARARCPFHP